MTDDSYRKSRVCYLLEADFEYLISILVSGSFLATLTSSLGIPDSLTGIISAFVGLGCLFQLLAVFLFRGGSVKRTVIAFSVGNQLLFLMLYLIPLGKGNPSLKIALFAVLILAAYMLLNAANPAKTDWFMSLVEAGSRGRFTAWKEMLSLVCGMAFTYGMSAVLDSFREAGDLGGGFAVCAGVMLLLTVLHTLTLLLAKEKPHSASAPDGLSPSARVFSLLRNPGVKKVMLTFLLWGIASNLSIPFYGTYLIKELGFSLKDVALLGIEYSVVRIAVSRLWGIFADRTSFLRMTRVCFFIAAGAFFVNAFTAPGTQRMLYAVYFAAFAVAMGGINSAQINLVYEAAPEGRQRDAIALNQAVLGTAGFLTALAVSPLVSMVQQNGNHLFGFSVYAQQAVSLLAALAALAAAFYAGREEKPAKGKPSRPWFFRAVLRRKSVSGNSPR